MKKISTSIPGLFIIESSVFRDERGGFQRLQCDDAFTAAGVPSRFVQTNLSTNSNRHILRGMHYQRYPHQEDKLIRCVKGAIFDVAIDIRRSSQTYGKYFTLELTEENALALLVPKGVAHGYLTLTDFSSVLYQVTSSYTPSAEGGIRWNDRRFAVDWPTDEPILSAKDAGWPDFQDSQSE